MANNILDKMCFNKYLFCQKSFPVKCIYSQNSYQPIVFSVKWDTSKISFRLNVISIKYQLSSIEPFGQNTFGHNDPSLNIFSVMSFEQNDLSANGFRPNTFSIKTIFFSYAVSIVLRLVIVMIHNIFKHQLPSIYNMKYI